ncbi:MAG: hypothetical protein KUG67_03685 [Proteobacteria bacterium]|nr:hypothetical protein [Pseudomonadota bacterium]
MRQDILEVMAGALNHSSKQVSESLSLIAKNRIEMDVGEISRAPYKERIGNSNASADVSFVAQQFVGDYEGVLTLVMGDMECVHLLSYCLGRSVSIDGFSENEHEAILELGNVILNAVFRSMLNVTQAHLIVAAPKYYPSLFRMNETVNKYSYKSDFITINLSYLCINSDPSTDGGRQMKVELQMKSQGDINRVLERML